MKILNMILRIILCLLMISPVLGALGVFPAPTPDLYNTPEAYNFIKTLYDSGYIIYMLGGIFFIYIILTIANRMAATALLLSPITVNIIGFHAFLDGGLFTVGAIMANVLLILNAYFLWSNREAYKILLRPRP